jgi:thioredoxin reductase
VQDRPASRPPCMRPRRGFARWCASGTRPAGRPARARGSRTIPAFRMASAARNSPGTYRKARRLGAEFLIGVEIESAHPESDQIIDLTLTSGARLRGRSGVIATGVAYRQLNAPGVEQFVGRGVHYGSASDAAPRYSGGHVVVVGGANSAGQAALHVAAYAKRVTMLVRGESLARGMSRYLVDRIEAHERIAVRTRTHVTRVEGGDWLEQAVVTGPDGEESLDASGMFVLIGSEPLTAGVEDWLRCDAGGYLMTGPALYAEANRSWWPLGTRPSLSRIEPARAVRRGRRSPRLDQASRVGRRRRRNVDRAGAQLPGYVGRREAAPLGLSRGSKTGARLALRWHARSRFERPQFGSLPRKRLRTGTTDQDGARSRASWRRPAWHPRRDGRIRDRRSSGRRRGPCPPVEGTPPSSGRRRRLQ